METVDMRDAFFNGLYDIISQNKNALVLTADHGAFGLTKIEKDFPDQFLNVGIAEQNMISFAAGLASTGKVVYVYSINNFISMRSLEQVNLDLCAMNSHVNLIGVGAGFTYSTDGPTHQGMQDAQAMMTLPGLQVYNVTDEVNSNALAHLGYNTPGPKYFRIEKGKNNKIYDSSFNILDGVSSIGSVNTSTLILSTGIMTHTALSVAKKLNQLSIGVVDVYRIKPLNEDKILNLIEKVDNVITLEECTYSGGLGEKIGFLLAKNNKYRYFLPIAVDDQHCFHYGDRPRLQKKYSLDENSIIAKIKNFLE
jgi:transketolase